MSQTQLKKVLVHATVKVTVEIQRGVWSSDCPLEQVYKQAKKEAIEHLQSSCEKNRLGIKFIEASVTAVLIPEKE